MQSEGEDECVCVCGGAPKPGHLFQVWGRARGVWEQVGKDDEVEYIAARAPELSPDQQALPSEV